MLIQQKNLSLELIKSTIIMPLEIKLLTVFKINTLVIQESTEDSIEQQDPELEQLPEISSKEYLGKNIVKNMFNKKFYISVLIANVNAFAHNVLFMVYFWFILQVNIRIMMLRQLEKPSRLSKVKQMPIQEDLKITFKAF